MRCFTIECRSIPWPVSQLGGRQTKKVLDANSTVSDKYKSTKAAKVA
jgi:hypothetical protein